MKRTNEILFYFVGISIKIFTSIGIQGPFAQEVDDRVDAGLVAVHLPVTTDEELATHYSRKKYVDGLKN